MLLSPLLVSLNGLRDQNYLLSSLPQLNNSMQLQQQHLHLHMGRLSASLNKMNYSKYIKNSVYYLEIKPIFCQSSAWSKKILNFHLSALIASYGHILLVLQHFPAAPHGLHQEPSWMLSLEQTWKPQAFYFFIFFPPPASHHTPSQFFCTKLGKKHYEILLRFAVKCQPP